MIHHFTKYRIFLHSLPTVAHLGKHAPRKTKRHPQKPEGCINPHHNLVPWAYHFDRFMVSYESNLPGVWRESPYTKNKPYFSGL